MTTLKAESPRIGVSVVDDERTIRDLLTKTLNATTDLRCLSAYATAEAAVAEIPRLKPQVVLLDISLPGLSGLECLPQIKAKSSESLVMMLSVDGDGEKVWTSLLAGARGFLVKHNVVTEVPDAVRTLVRDGRFLGPQAGPALIAFIQQMGAHGGPFEGLTLREREVCSLLCAGRRNKEIADALGLSEGAVRAHVTSIYAKLKVHSRVAALAQFMQRASSQPHGVQP